MLAIAAGSSAHAEVVFNGGFETGTFDGWSVPPFIPNQQYFVISNGSGHDGPHYARISSSTLQFISQVLPTEAGTDYELSFWLRRPGSVIGSPFTVRWEGQVCFNELVGGPEVHDWARFSVPLHANFNLTFLEFGQSIFPGEFQIDDISVVQVPGPGSAAVFAAAGVCAARRRRR